MTKYRKFTPEYRDEAVLMVIQTQRPIAQVARELGVNEGTLGTRVGKCRNKHPGPRNCHCQIVPSSRSSSAKFGNSV